MSAPTFPSLAAAADRLRCPHCGAALLVAGGSLACAGGHRYDIARQGYVSLLPPRGLAHPGDSSEMVAARDKFLGAGHYTPIADGVTAAALEAVGSLGDRSGCAVDIGAGTGYYVARLLERLPGWSGIALDASRPALRRAVRANPRIAAIACDAWQALPVRDGAADLALNVFAPRDGREIARVLAPHGALIVVTPTEHHLRELAPLPGMLTVDADKQERLRAKLSPLLTSVHRHPVEFELGLNRADAQALVGMGPSAHHVDTDQLERQLSAMPETLAVTASVVVETFRRLR
jgi:23S rRNA (guanine745-N1)-methyltransferase